MYTFFKVLLWFYADTSDEEIHTDDLSVNEAVSDDDSPSLTASSGSYIEVDEMGQSADASSRFYLCVLKPLAHFIMGYKG